MEPDPNGGLPQAAKATVQPQEKMSEAGPTASPDTCSGDMYAGVPSTALLASASASQATPKSMTLGPTCESSTLDGFRSRWTTPAPWMARRAMAIEAASPSRAEPRSGPEVSTASLRLGPSTYSVTRYASRPCTSASRTGAVQKRATRWAAATSRAKRRLKSGCASILACSSLTATRVPDGSRAR